MTEVVRRFRVALLFVEMTMLLGAPTPRAVSARWARIQMRRQDRRRSRSLPRRTRAYEQLVRLNPGLGEGWKRSVNITRKAALR